MSVDPRYIYGGRLDRELAEIDLNRRAAALKIHFRDRWPTTSDAPRRPNDPRPQAVHDKVNARLALRSFKDDADD
jgi:hypothetical protein